MAGIDMVHVAYKGLGPAMTDLLGGQIQLMLADIGVVAPHLKSGKLRGLAITGRSRSPVFSELPTVAEAGLPGYAAGTWCSLFARRPARRDPRAAERRVRRRSRRPRSDRAHRAKVEPASMPRPVRRVRAREHAK
jgi:tripartite-type tricarboxylate transporter receptor subunit TctC